MMKFLTRARLLRALHDEHYRAALLALFNAQSSINDLEHRTRRERRQFAGDVSVRRTKFVNVTD